MLLNRLSTRGRGGVLISIAFAAGMSDTHSENWRFQYRRRKDKTNVVFYSHFEEVLQKIKPFGAYQIFAFIVILYAQIEWAGNATFMDVLGTIEPNWLCTGPNGTQQTIYAPTDADGGNKCEYLKTVCNNNFTAIKNSTGFYSIVANFKLICDRKDKVRWIQIIQATGSCIGSIFGGHIGDLYGRKTMFFSAQLLIIITSIMCTASRDWIAFAALQAANCFLYGVTTLTMMMEYTNNRYRVVMANAFQWPVAYMVQALIGFLTKDWQRYFIFLNLVCCPLTIAFMLFLESPRWLIADGRLNKACNVLNDIAHERWNNTKTRFTTNDISAIYKREKRRFYNFSHLFSSSRLAKQSIMQIISMLTYALVSNTYLFTASEMHDSAIMFTFLDGVFRLFTPFLIICLDLTFPAFGRKIQFIGSVLLEMILFGVCILLVSLGNDISSKSVTVLVIITIMINDCVFWINIVQITTQRYPTVIRCTAFGCLLSVSHLGTIIGIVLLRPLLNSSWPTAAFLVPEVMLTITLVFGLFLQPETKGKALMDQMVEANYGRLENELPRALIRLAAGHKLAQIEVRRQLKADMEAAEAAVRAGHKPDHNPWEYKGEREQEERKEAASALQGSEHGCHDHQSASTLENRQNDGMEDIELYPLANGGYEPDSDDEDYTKEAGSRL